MTLSLARVLRGSLSGFLVLSRAASGAAIGALVGVLSSGEGANPSQPLAVGLAITGAVVATALVGWRGHGGKRGLPRAFAVVVLAVAAFAATWVSPLIAAAPEHAWQLSVGAGALAAAAVGVWLLEPPPGDEASEASEPPSASA